MTPKTLNLAGSNRIMHAMLGAVTTPAEISAKLRTARLSPADINAMRTEIVSRAQDQFDTDAHCYRKLHAQAEDVQAVQLDGHAMLLAASYTRYLLGDGGRDVVLRDMITLHQTLMNMAAGVNPADAEQAVHEILNGATFMVNEAITEARARDHAMSR